MINNKGYNDIMIILNLENINNNFRRNKINQSKDENSAIPLIYFRNFRNFEKKKKNCTFWKCFQIHKSLHRFFFKHSPGIFGSYCRSIHCRRDQTFHLNLMDPGRTGADFDSIQKHLMFAVGIGRIPANLSGNWGNSTCADVFRSDHRT